MSNMLSNCGTKAGAEVRNNYFLNYFRIALDLLLQAVGMNTFFLSISEIVFTAVYVIIFLVIFPTYRTCYHMSMVRISFWFFLCIASYRYFVKFWSYDAVPIPLPKFKAFILPSLMYTFNQRVNHLNQWVAIVVTVIGNTYIKEDISILCDFILL